MNELVQQAHRYVSEIDRLQFELQKRAGIVGMKTIIDALCNVDNVFSSLKKLRSQTFRKSVLPEHQSLLKVVHKLRATSHHAKSAESLADYCVNHPDLDSLKVHDEYHRLAKETHHYWGESCRRILSKQMSTEKDVVELLSNPAAISETSKVDVAKRKIIR